MKLRLMKVTKRNGIEKKEVVATWSDITPKKAKIIAYNYRDGFKLGTTKDWRYSLTDLSWQSWRYHDSNSGTKYYFTNRRNTIIKI